MSRIDDILNKIFLWDEELNYSDKFYLKEYIDYTKAKHKEDL